MKERIVSFTEVKGWASNPYQEVTDVVVVTESGHMWRWKHIWDVSKQENRREWVPLKDDWYLDWMKNDPA